MQKKEKNSYRKSLQELEKNKNLLVSAALMAELKKVEPLVINTPMKAQFLEWQHKFEVIKTDDVPRITDMLLEAEDNFDQKDYKVFK